MKFGTKYQFEHIQKSLEKNPKKLEDINNRIIWISDNFWYIPEDKDGEKEHALLEKIKATRFSMEAALPNSAVEASTGGTLKHTHGFKIAVPHQKPPPFLSRVAQFLTTVTGPKVTEEVFQSRFRKCTHEAGCTFSPIDGTVTEVGKGFVKVGTTLAILPSDETASVVVGQVVQHGQTLSTSDNAKPCPMLNVENKSGEPQYFCGGCGCGERRAAELRNKLYYVRVTCPRTPPQFTAEDENGPNVAK